MIELIRAFPYDNNYDYIKTFSSQLLQDQYFDSLSKLYVSDNEYIKDHETFLVPYNYDYLVNEGINYVCFNNGYKDIFAFIIQKEYVNDEATRIIFEIDVIQTYMFDFNINKSFIERKKCNISEISDYDEGLDLGEHVIDVTHHVFDKDSTYFAMFNGIKEQQVIFNDKGTVTNVISVPFSTSKPLTIVDGIQYPLFFMPLKETYKEAIINPITPPTGGGVPGGNGSDVVTSARKLIGLPYIFGGNYPPLGNDPGTDCSGLCQWAYNDCNLLVNVGLGGRWTTHTMIEHATYIKSVDMAKPGDIVFSNFIDGYPEHVALISQIDGVTLKIVEAQQEGVPILERTMTFDSSKHEIRRLLNG